MDAQAKTRTKVGAAILIFFNLIGLFAIDRSFGFFFPAYPTYLNKKTHDWDSYETNPRNYFKATGQDPNGKLYYTIDRSHEEEREYENVKIPGDAVQILAIGDSFTFGQGVRLEDTYSKRLERVRASHKVYGINLGRSGDNVGEVLDHYQNLANHYHPSLVIYGYVLNDPVIQPDPGKPFHWMDTNPQMNSHYDGGLNWDFMNLRGPAIRSLRGSFTSWLGSHSRIADYVIALYERKKISSQTILHYLDIHDPTVNSKGLDETFKKIARMNEIAKNQGSRFLVMIFPIFYGIEKSYPFSPAHRYVQERLAKMGIDSLDLLPFYQGYRTSDLWVHPVDQHPNDVAHKVAADALEGWIRKNTTLFN